MLVGPPVPRPGVAVIAALVLLPPLGWWLVWSGPYPPQTKTTLLRLSVLWVVFAVVVRLFGPTPAPTRSELSPTTDAVEVEPAAPVVSAAPTELPHLRARCSWLVPAAWGERHLVEIRSEVLRGDLYSFGGDASHIEIELEMGCYAFEVPTGTHDVVDADGIALYVGEVSPFQGVSAGAWGDRFPVRLGFEGVTTVDEHPRTVTAGVSAISVRAGTPHARLRDAAIAAARQFAAYIRARVSGPEDVAARVQHWNSLLASLHSDAARAQWMVGRVDRYASVVLETEDYVAHVGASTTDPFLVEVRFNRRWAQLPAQEQDRRLRFLHERWTDTHEVPEPNVGSGARQRLGPYDPRPFDSRLAFIDAAGNGVASSPRP